MRGLSARDLVAGALLVVLVVAVAVFVDSDRPAFEDEAVVLAAISAVAPAEENCDISYGLNSDELGRYAWHERTYGVTWGLPHTDDTIKRVVIKCVVSEDIHEPRWDQWGVWFDLHLRYPLKSGNHAEAINEQTRSEVAGIVTEYLTNAGERVESYSRGMRGLPDDSHHRMGYLEIYGFASLMNDGLYSVHMESVAHDPGANTSLDYLRTQNYDLATGERFFLPDMLYPGEDSYKALVRLAVENHNFHVRDGQDRGVLVRNCCVADVEEYVSRPYEPERLQEQHFSLTANSLALDCVNYCFQGVVSNLLFKNNALEVPYEHLAEHLDPNGPYRHILNN